MTDILKFLAFTATIKLEKNLYLKYFVFLV